MEMKLFPLTLVVVMLVVGVKGAPAESKSDQLKDFALNEIIPNKFGVRGLNASWVTEKDLLYRDVQGNYIKYDVVTKEGCIILDSKALSNWSGASAQFIRPNLDKILIRYDARTVFRHSTLAKYALFDITTNTSYKIANGEEVSICKLSPGGKSLAYVKDNNVFYRPNSMNDEELPLTQDGVPGVIYNGVPDWVYEEEVFGTDATLWFSNDGSHIAMASFDDTQVKEFTYHVYGEPDDPKNQYPEDFTLRYPKVNTTNPTVHLRVMNLNANPRVWREVPAPVEIVTNDHILGTVNWIGEDLGMIWTNRRQNVATFQRCSIQSLQCTELARVNEPNGWYDLYTPRCTTTGDRCFFLGDNAGWRRIWQLDGNAVTFKSPERFTVTGINGYDEVNKKIYYTAVPAENPQHRHVFDDEGCLTCDLLKDKLDGDVPCNYASISFSTDYSHFAATCSGPTPAYMQIFRTADRQPLIDWEWNVALRNKLANYKKTQVKFIKVPVGDGFEASVRLYLPPEIDFEDLKNNEDKYPMIVQVYGGPNSVRVTDNFGIGFGDYLTTTKKTIYCQIDGRGTGNQGYKFLFTVNNRLGTFEIEDQIAVTHYLQEKYSFIDRERTGIWGWSYGGYATSMTLEKDSEKVFKCGISVAPVTSWMFYDSIYTERYMGVPTAKDNTEGYKRGDVSQYVSGMKNHSFLLIHGNADDNVHYQNAMVFVRALVLEDVEFEQMSYPDEAHGLSGVQQHLYHTMDNFWNECFK
ncbi:venom dipeptidyl peptidase 4 [Toxorhynchites rutilus septentrionalis]|uniref:venom dipeptidyl peptidase 4 n=1 Tax=Toxorhynchites rutilus septentrionalis TaxID=329112 RepID=UPI00247A5D6E|nr:venom dipeptidyl peptidase 4 [Toxorhynchites rutilus septentrionalis]XP_055640245.1 venom dipeptidyl peptidase 4 [Toxorhynchites rutilus septentrionalis]